MSELTREEIERIRRFAPRDGGSELIALCDMALRAPVEQVIRVPAVSKKDWDGGYYQALRNQISDIKRLNPGARIEEVEGE